MDGPVGVSVFWTCFSSVGVHPEAAVEAEIITAAVVQQPEAVCLIISSPDVCANTLRTPSKHFEKLIFFWHFG